MDRSPTPPMAVAHKGPWRYNRHNARTGGKAGDSVRGDLGVWPSDSHDVVTTARWPRIVDVEPYAATSGIHSDAMGRGRNRREQQSDSGTNKTADNVAACV